MNCLSFFFHIKQKIYFLLSNLSCQNIAGVCICLALPLRIKQMFKYSQLPLILELSYPRNVAEGWSSCWQKEGRIKDGALDDKDNAFEFQRDADISTFETLDRGLALPPSYLSSQVLAPGKKWWKAAPYLNASSAWQVHAFIQTSYEYWKPCFMSTKHWSEEGLMDNLPCLHCDPAAIWGRMKRLLPS